MSFISAALIALSFVATPKIHPGQWTQYRAQKWFQSVSPIKGVDYEPSTAVNDTEIWQAETFDPKTIDRELGMAHDIGFNNVRVFLQYIVWQQDPRGFKKRFSQLLSTADKHGIRVMPVLFDDCNFAGEEPYLGKQLAPIPGVHNSQWTPSPGHREVTDRTVWPKLEAYVKDMVRSFGRDRRVLIWDLYNEPGNCGMGEKSRPLLEAAFAWAREVKPSQPLTAGVWDSATAPLSQQMLELSDVVSFHGYDDASTTRKKIEACRAAGRPVLCTEWLAREFGSTFQAILPVFADENVGWYSTALVAGKTQAYMHWNSKPGTPEPKIWQHCVFRQDGTLYDPAEIALIKAWAPLAR